MTPASTNSRSHGQMAASGCRVMLSSSTFSTSGVSAAITMPTIVAVGGALAASAFDEAVDNGGDRGLGDGQAISELRRPLAPLVDECQHSELGQRETSGAALERASETNQRADIRVPHDPHQH